MRLAFLAPLLLAAACQSTGGGERSLAAEIAAAHGAGSLYDRAPLHAHVVVGFGGSTVLESDMVFDAATGRVRLELADGRVAVFDGRDAWAAGFAPEERAMARFHLLTWSYFAAAPWKIGDPGTVLGPVEARELAGRTCPSALLTFAGGVGDTPDDWYVVHADPEDSRLAALAYVVTFGTTLEEAEAEPHAAVYERYERVGGLAVPAELRFWNWSEDEGLVGEPIGEARFEDLRFAPAPGAFEPPEDAVRVPLPAPAGA